jgi:hypothetical protein
MMPAWAILVGILRVLAIGVCARGALDVSIAFPVVKAIDCNGEIPCNRR